MPILLYYTLPLLGTTVFLRKQFWEMLIKRLEIFESSVSQNIQIIDFL